MKNTQEKKTFGDSLRQNAEETLKDKPIQNVLVISNVDALKLVHELEVNQVELKMQNEELIHAQSAVQDAIDLYDFAPNGYFTLSKLGKIIGSNLYGAKLLNSERTGLKDCLFSDFIDEASKSIFLDFLQKVADNIANQTCEITLLTSELSAIYVCLNGTLSKNKDQCLITAIDISERKQTEAIIQQEHELYLDIVNNQPAGIYRIRVFQPEKWWDKDWNSSENPPYRMELASDRFCEILGLSRETFETNPAIIVDLIHPEDKSEFVIKNEAASDRIIPFVWDGRLVINENVVWVHLESIPRVMSTGEILWTGILYDITAQKQGEGALKESETKYRELIDNSPDAISIYSDGIIVYVNNESLRLMVASNVDELLGKSVIEYIHPDYRALAIKRMSKVANDRSGQPLTEEKFIRLDGTPVDVEVKSMPIMFQNKPAVQLIIRDITERKKIEKSHIDSEDRFQQLFNKAPLGYQSLDVDGHFIEVNQQWLDMLGFTREEVIGKWFGDFLSPEYKDGFRKRFPVFKAQGHIHSEFEMVHKNGEALFIAFDGRVGFDLKGEFKQTHCILQDITQRRLVDSDLKKSQEDFKDLFDNAPIGYHELDSEGRIVRMNQTELDMLGYTKKDLIGQYIWKIAHNEDQTKKEVLDKLNGKKESSTSFETILVGKNGKKYNILILDRILRDTNQKVTGIRTTIQDITERKKAEEALRESETLYRNLVLTIPDGIYKSTHDGRFVDVNPAMVKMFGYETKEELMNIDIKKQLYFDSTDRATLALNKIYEDTGIYKMKKKDGSTLWVDDHGWYNLDSDGKVETHEGVLRDVTERKNAENALRDSEEKYRYLFENNPQSMYIYDVETLAFLEVNLAAIEQYGYSKEDFLQMKLTDIRPPEDIPALLIDIRENPTDIKPSGVWRHIRKNGELIYVDITTVSVESKGRNARHVLIQDITERKHAEHALRVNEEKFRTITEQIDDFITICDSNGIIRYGSPASIELFQYEPEEMYGHHFMEFIHEESLPVAIKAIAAFTAGIGDRKKAVDIELKLKRKDGSVFFGELNGSQFMFEDQLGSLVILHDITNRKHTIEQLMNSEEKFRSIAEQTSDLISITDIHGVILYASSSSKSIFSYEPEEMCGHYYTEFLDLESIKNSKNAFRKSLETGESVSNLELTMKRKDGSKFYGELNGSSFKYGGNYGTLVVVRDISERKKAQEELVEKMNELLRFHNLTVGRELTMIELKKEVNNLLKESGEEEKYKIVK